MTSRPRRGRDRIHDGPNHPVCRCVLHISGPHNQGCKQLVERRAGMDTAEQSGALQVRSSDIPRRVPRRSSMSGLASLEPDRSLSFVSGCV